jgi:hypothetical protein
VPIVSEIEIHSAPRKAAGAKTPRHPYHEIADLLASLFAGVGAALGLKKESTHAQGKDDS